MRLGNIQNTAGVSHTRCCAIAEILWSRRRLNYKKKIGDGYVKQLSPPPQMHCFDCFVLNCIVLIVSPLTWIVVVLVLFLLFGLYLKIYVTFPTLFYLKFQNAFNIHCSEVYALKSLIFKNIVLPVWFSMCQDTVIFIVKKISEDLQDMLWEHFLNLSILLVTT